MRFLFLLFFAVSAQAAEVGVTHSTYNSSHLEAEGTGFRVMVGQRYNLWAGYEKPDVMLVGQSMGSIALRSVGVGLSHEIGKFRFFGEFGYFDPKVKTSDVIRDEAVITALNNNHGWRGRKHFKQTTYKVSPGYGGRVGVSYSIRPHIVASVAYRALVLDEDLDAYTGDCSWPPTKACKDWWREDKNLSFSVVEFGLAWRFGEKW